MFIDSLPSPLSPWQALGPLKPQPTIQSLCKESSERLEGREYCSCGQPSGAGCSWICFSQPFLYACCMKDSSSTLWICKSWRKPTQLSVFPGIAPTTEFCKQKEIQVPSWIQAAVCLVLNHELLSGRRCHHQRCRDGLQKRLEQFPTHLRANVII